MRLRWGPHARRLAEQVVLADPHYVLSILDQQPHGVLAEIFRELILLFDAKPLAAVCARCDRTAISVCAYPGSVELIGVCGRCTHLFDRAQPAPAFKIDGYADALRHVVMSCRRAHRLEMRRIIRHLLTAKAGPDQLTERSVTDFFGGRVPFGLRDLKAGQPHSSVHSRALSSPRRF